VYRKQLFSAEKEHRERESKRINLKINRMMVEKIHAAVAFVE
jgi:hypothetical protein